MDFLKNTDNSDMILWHGTCADFDIFYPLSYFAVNRHVSNSAEFYQKQRYAHRKFISDDEITTHALQELQESLSRVLGNKTSLQSQEKHPNFKIIPAHLKMKNPLQLSSWEFHLNKALIGLVWGLTRREQENSLDTMQEANVTGDFIFKGSIGRTDLYTGKSVIMKLSLEKFKSLKLGDFCIMPGHDKTTNFVDEIKNNPYLK